MDQLSPPRKAGIVEQDRLVGSHCQRLLEVTDHPLGGPGRQADHGQPASHLILQLETRFDGILVVRADDERDVVGQGDPVCLGVHAVGRNRDVGIGHLFHADDDVHGTSLRFESRAPGSRIQPLVDYHGPDIMDPSIQRIPNQAGLACQERESGRVRQDTRLQWRYIVDSTRPFAPMPMIAAGTRSHQSHPRSGKAGEALGDISDTRYSRYQIVE